MADDGYFVTTSEGRELMHGIGDIGRRVLEVTC